MSDVAHLPYYSNEDGDAWVLVESEPDRDVAGQRIADETGIVHTFEGREPIRVQDCECVPTTDHCLDDPSGAPCVVQDQADCWHFVEWDDPKATWGNDDHLVALFSDLLGSLDDEPPVPIYWPGQTTPINSRDLPEFRDRLLAERDRAASAAREAASVELFRNDPA